MASTVKGTVEKIHKNGRFYSIVVDAKWYGVGANQPQFAEGDMVEFATSTNDKGYVNADGPIEVLGKGKAPAPQSRSKVSTGRVEHTNEREDYWKNKEARDVRNDVMREIGAGRNTAIAFVGLLLSNEALALPAKKEAKADALFAAVEYYREKFSGAESNATATVENVEEEQDEEDSYE